MTRVAYVVADPGIPVFGRKGASVHVQEVVRALRSSGADVRLFATRLGDDVPADLADLAVEAVPVAASDPAGRELAVERAARTLADRVAGWGPDVVYERFSLFAAVAVDAAERTGAASIVEVNAPLIEEQRAHRILAHEQLATALARRALRDADRVVAVSGPVAEWTAAHGAARPLVVPNGVATDRFEPARHAGAAGDPVVVGFVGTLKPWHGVLELVDATAAARELGVDARLRVIGDGPGATMLREHADDRGVPLELTGALPPALVPERLIDVDVALALAASDAAGYFSPLKVYEYLAAGLPIVATRSGQLAEIVPADVGTLVEPGDAAAAGRAIAAYAADPVGRRDAGARGRELTAANHSWTGVVDAAFAGVAALPGSRTVAEARP